MAGVDKFIRDTNKAKRYNTGNKGLDKFLEESNRAENANIRREVANVANQWAEEYTNRSQMAELENSVLAQTGGITPNFTTMGGLPKPKGPKTTFSTPLDNYRSQLSSTADFTTMSRNEPAVAPLYSMATLEESNRALQTFQPIDDFYREHMSGTNRNKRSAQMTEIEKQLREIMNSGSAVERELAKDYEALFQATHYTDPGSTATFVTGVANALQTYTPEMVGGLTAAVADPFRNEAFRERMRALQGENAAEVSGRGEYTAGYKALDEYFAFHPDAFDALQAGKPVWTEDIKAQTGTDEGVLRSYLMSTSPEARQRSAIQTAVKEYGLNEKWATSVYNQGVQLGRQIPGMMLTMGAGSGTFVDAERAGQSAYNAALAAGQNVGQAATAYEAAIAETFKAAGGGGGGLLGTLMSGGTLGTATKSALKGNLATYLIGAMSASGAYSSNIREHDYGWQNYVNAVGKGFAEYFTEGLFGFSDMPSYEAMFVNPVGKAGNRVLMAMLGRILGGLEEGAEEVANVPIEALVDMATGYSSGGFDRMLEDPAYFNNGGFTGVRALFEDGGLFDVNAMWESGVSGAIGGWLMGMAGAVMAVGRAIAEGKEISSGIERINREAEQLPAQYRPQRLDPNTARREDVEAYEAQVLKAIDNYYRNVVVLHRDGQNIDVTGIDTTPAESTVQANTEANAAPVLHFGMENGELAVQSVTNDTIEDAMQAYGDQLSQDAKVLAAEAYRNYRDRLGQNAAPARQFVNEFTQAFLYGKDGATVEQAKANLNTELLTDATMEAAVEAGAAATAQDTAETAEPVNEADLDEFAADFTMPERVKEIYNMQPGLSTSEFAESFQTAYDMGNSGVSTRYLSEENTPGLTNEQRNAAYQMGRTDAQTTATRRDENTRAQQKSGNLLQAKGTVRGQDVSIADLKKTFNDPQNTAYRLLVKYAETTGVNIVLYRSQADENGDFAGENGHFEWKDNTIYIDLNSGLFNQAEAKDLGKYAMMRTFAHEFTHFIEKWNATSYNEFREFVFDTLDSRGENVNDLIQAKQALDQSGNMSYEQASREVVADAMTDILPDSTLVQQLAEEQPNVFRRLLAKLRAFVARMRQYYSQLTDKGSREAEALKENGRYLESVVRMWDSIAKGAVKNYQGATGQLLIDQPAKPENLPRRPRRTTQRQTAQQQTEEAQPVQQAEPAQEVKTEAPVTPVAQETQESAPVMQEETQEDKTVTEETPEAANLRARLNAGNGPVIINGFEYAITGWNNRTIDIANNTTSNSTTYTATVRSVDTSGPIPVYNGRDLFNGQFQFKDDAVEALVQVAINNHLLEEVNTNGRAESQSEAPVSRGETNADRNGEGTVRVPVPVQEGNVQGDAAGRDTSSVSSERGGETGRNGGRPDAERNGSGRSAGADESGVQSGRRSLVTEQAETQETTPEPVQTEAERQEQAEELHDTTEHDVAQKSTEEPGGNNYQIGESLNLPNGSKARYKANVEAIRLVKQLEAEGRNATPAEQETLSRYVGWGGISEAFDERKSDWSREYAELKELLTEEEYNAAKGSTLNAHYTSIPVIRAMYRGLDKLGFKGGRMLEPSSGVGNFVGAMPAEMSAKVRSWTMVELDNITGLIAKHLYPQNDVRIEGFEKAIIPDNFMDVAISNVPFGNYPVVDRAYPKKITSAIHNYFFAKSLDKVRPGGLVMFITSSYTMNAYDKTVRSYISKRADLLGAIRLPNTAFSGNAGTSVVTDILVLKKRNPGTEYAGVPFVETAYDYKLGYQNEYFAQHPDMVLGEQVTSRGMYSRNEYTVNPYTDRGSLEEQIDKAFQNITGQMDYPVRQTPEQTNVRVQRAERGTKQGGYVQREGKLYQNDNGELKEVQTDEKTAERITGMLGIRDLSQQLLNAQQQGRDQKDIKAIRRSLNKAYDEFVKKYGFLNNAANRKAFSDDPDRYSLYALEDWDSEKKTAKKADIFTTDTIKPNVTITHADNVKDGLSVSRNITGGVDVPMIARLTGKSEADVTRELIDSELAYKNREGQLEPAEVYLSGNVRAKLRDAQGLVGIDRDYQHNVDALKRIVPADIPHEQIFVQPGTPWIPTSVYSRFAVEMLGGWRDSDITINRSNQTGTFTIDVNNKRLKGNYQNTQEWGTPKRTFLNLLEAVMNSRSVTVTYKDSEGHTIVDRVATDAANEKIEQITKKFQEWLWKDEDRTKDLEYLYNETFNNLVTPKYDGSELVVNGLRAGYSLLPHQADAVQRVVSSGGNTLLAHRVGAGKTMEMAAAAMKLKELGIVQKPMFAVPKSLVAQWGKEFTSYFPAAKLLVAEQSDFTPANRKTFANRIATGNYDAIIVSYEQFEKIPISDSFALSMYQEQINEIIQAINEAKAESGKNSMSVKDMEKKRKQLEAKIQKLTDKAKDTDNIEFEKLGVDSIFVDEAHNFKNLFYTTSMNNVSGLGNKDGSKRAFDLYTKVRYLQQLNGGRGVVFATATPVMNSMSEMYIMQKYLQPDLLNQLGLSTFDAWAKQFGEIVNGVEIKPSGQGYRVKQSFSRFKNMSELQLLFRNFSDVLTKIPGLKIPRMKGGAVKVVECEAGEFQQNYMKELENRADNIKNVDPSEDNMLKITSDGRKISYTQRMIDPSLPYEEGCKIFRCADNIAAEYKESKAIRGTQIVFLDMATPKGKSNSEKAAAEEDDGMDTESAQLYQDLKRRLVKLGIPGKEIAFIHDADTDAKKSKLFEDVNEGRVRVLIGSTGKMGVGMNAQKRIVAIHHLDAPWRPGDVEQRDGRAFRQKNINEEVSKYVYVTKGSFDARLWDIIDRKSNFIDQIMNGENVGRDVEDTGEVTLSAAEVKALASGSPLILEQVQLETDIKKLQNLYMAHMQSVAEAGRKLQEAKRVQGEAETRAANARQDIRHRTDASRDETFSITVGKRTYTDKKDAGKALMAEAAAKAVETDYTKIGSFAGFDVLAIQTKEGIFGLLKADGAYRFNTYPDNTTLMITNMQKVLNGLETTAQAADELAQQKAQEIKAQEAMIKAPFPRQEELDQKRQRYNEVMEILNPKEEQKISEDEDEGNVEYSLRVRQEFTSAATSLNQVAALFKSKVFDPGDVNIDIGGGAYNATTEYLAEQYGTTNMVFDPYNRGSEENLATLDFLRAGNRADTATCANVLNVIKEADSRRNVILEVAKSIKEDGTAYFSVYEKDKSGQGRQTGADQWQNSRATADYVSEIEEFFDNVERHGGVIVATNPKSDLPAAFWRITEEQEIAYSSRRPNSPSNREILRMAANEIDVEGLTDAEKNALEIFNTRLDRLQAAEEQRTELGRQYRDETFTKGGSKAEAAKIKAQMGVMDTKIKALENSVLALENKDVLKNVLQKARTVVEQQERQRGEEKLKQYRARRNESVAARKYRESIRHEVERLHKWLMHPSNKNVKQHVPAELQKSVADFIDSINLMSKTALRTSGLETTKADAKYIKAMRQMHDAIQHNVDTQGIYSGYADLPDGFIEEFNDMVNTAQEIIDRNSGEYVVNQMTSPQLKQLLRTIRSLTHYLTTMNEYHNNQMFRHAYEASEDTIDTASELAPSKKSGNIYKFMRFDYMRPSFVFEHFGKGAMSIEQEFRDGQAIQARLAKQIEAFAKKTFTAKEADKWSNETHTVELDSGEKITLQTAQIMSLYALLQRKQALPHIYGEGIRGANYKNGREVIRDTAHVVTEADTQRITSLLTDRQIEVVNALQNYMSTVANEWGNYVSIKRFDQEQFTEEHYWPINSDGRYIPATADEMPDNAGLYALLNVSFSKETKENARNSIILYNAFDVFANHTAQMTQYRSFALPVLDALKWFNYKDGNRSVRTALSMAYGSPDENRPGGGVKGYAENFVLNLLRAYNGAEGMGDSFDSAGLRMLHRNNRAAIAYNLRVYIQQPMAITRAAMMLSPTKLMKGLGMSVSHLRSLATEMEQHSGIALWKSLGFYDTNISRGLTDLIKQKSTFGEKVTEVGTKPAEFLDRLTWAAIWYAAKDSENRSNYDSEEAYFDAVTKRFEDVIYKTQVVDSILTKSEFMRSKGFLARTLGSFMSEPMTTTSMLTDAYYRYAEDMQRGMSRSEAWKKNGKNIGKTAAVYMIGQALLAAVQSFIDAYRDNDEEYADYWEKYWEEFKANLVDEMLPFGKVPVISELYEFLKARLDKAGVFDKIGIDLYGQGPSSGWMEYVNYLAKGIDIAVDRIRGNETEYTWWGAIYNTIKAGASATGYPVATLTREVIDLWNNAVGHYAPSMKVLSYKNSDLNNIKYGYLDGYLTQDEAIRAILDKGEAKDENEAYWMVRKWDGEDKYSDLKAAIYNGDTQAILSEQIQLTDHGVTEKDIQKEVKQFVHHFYNGDFTDAEKNIVTENTMTDEWAKRIFEDFGMDMDEDDIHWTLEKWEYEAENDGETFYKYDEFYSAVETGKNLKSTIQYYLDHGVSADTLASQITKEYKPKYIELYRTNKSAAASLQGYLLNAYEALGKDREKKIKDIAKWLED